MFDSLWGEEFSIKETPKQAKKIIEKVNKPKKVKVTTEKAIKSKSVSLKDKLELITNEVIRILGVYKESTVVIKTKQELVEYIDKAIINGEIAIDTETNNSLEPLTCKLMGPCIYTPGMKNAYIPLNHVNPDTNERLDWQLTENDIAEQFARLTNTNIIMHNGKFDYQVIKCTTGVQLKVYWDTMLGARMLNENEPAGLKVQYIQKIDSSIEKYDIEHLFKDIEYAVVDPEIFALYAATDAFMTYKLYQWQKNEFSSSELSRVYDVFINVEMPVMEVAAEMELTGVCIDTEYAARLSAKYHDKVNIVDQQIADELKKYDAVIAEWRLTDDANYKASKINPKTGEAKLQKSKNEQLESPISVTSPTQLAILIYDVLQQPVVDKEKPRGTGEDILTKIDLPICKLILEKRGLEKLIGTYIDKLPQCVCSKTGRLHAHFNQIGADTGRFSSSDPNLQNIPSHEKSIRMIFSAAPGHVLVGSDFSQQEPRLLSNFSSDDNMINAYKQGKDLYATIASGVYNNDYWDNMESHEDGSPNPEGKKRRSSCKSLLLGIMYGRGVASVAEQIKGTIKEAQKIIDDFYTSFPKVKKWIDETQENAKKLGYVEDLWGRRRRLPDIQLPKYSINFKDNSSITPNFNPLLGSEGIVGDERTPLLAKYNKLANECRNRKDVERVKTQALTENIIVRDNGGFISQAERQCVNARIQGSAATMSKRAMIKVHNDPELNALGFKLMIAVHDELIGECPEENADAVANRLCDIMKVAALPECQVPFKCDPTIEKSWYYTDYSDVLREKYVEKINSGVSPNEAFSYFTATYSECTEEQLREILNLA